MSKRSVTPSSLSALRLPRGKSKPIRHGRRPLMERLEDRIVPSTAYLSGLESIAHPIVPVALQQPATQPVTVSYAVVSGGTAVSGKDYTLAPGKLTFNPGDSIKDIPLQILDDGLAETNETIFIKLSAPKGAPLGPTTQMVYTILKSEPLPSVAFATSTGSGLESKAGSFQVTLSAKSKVPVTVAYAVTGGTATGGGVDYTLKPGTITFRPGVTAETVAIPIVNDKLNEPNETIQVALVSPVNAALGSNSTFTYTILDNEPQPSVAFTTTAGSGLETVRTPVVPVSLSAVSGQAVTVQYSVTGGTALSSVNYSLTNGTLIFPAGVKTENIPLTILDNGILSSSPTVQITLSTPSNATLGSKTGFIYTILNPGSLPTVAFQATTGAGDEGKPASVQVILLGPSTKPVTVQYAVTGGTATAGKNYTLKPGTLTIKPGTTAGTITIPTIDDKLNEPDKTIQLTLSSPGGAFLGGNTVFTYTIQNDDPQPSIGFTKTIGSGLETLSNPSVSVSLSAASGQAVTVQYVVSGGSATSGVNYAPSDGTLTINPGSKTASIPLTILDGAPLTSAQTVLVTLSAPNNATLGSNSVFTYTILTTPAQVGFDSTPPVLTVLSPGPGLITASNVTVTGTAMDDFSGLASLSAAVDGGSAVHVPVGTTGAFSFPVSTASLADGTHTVTFHATDDAGNTSTTNVSFVLDATAPVVTINSPAAGLVTNAASVTVTGDADGRVAGLASLQAQIDGGSPFGVSYDGSGNFSFGVATTDLTDGSHTITLSAADKAGNVATSHLTFSLDTHPPTVVIQSPASGLSASGNVTVTGQVTDTGSGVASLQEAMDGGAYAPLTFDPSTGNFSFTTALALDGSADGPHTVTVEAADNAGNVSSLASLSFGLVTITQLATPVLDPASDHGPSHTDGITNDTTPIVHVAAPSGLKVSLLVGGELTQQAVSVGGTATFTLGPLADGTYSIVAAVAGIGGSLHSNSNPLSVTILTTTPAAPTFDLAAGTADLGPETTSSAHVTLVGQTSPGYTVSLVSTGLSALASGTGLFQIPGVSLTAGANTLAVQATDLAGNVSNSATLTVTYTPPTSSTPPNAVIVWNQATLNAIQTDGTDPVMSSRALAIVQAAVYDAVNNIEGTPAYYVKVTAPADASIDAAVDAAAHDALVYLYPAQQATFDALLISQLALLPTGQGTTDGETVGQAVGNAIIAMRVNDGSTSYVDFEPGTAAGDWQPTGPAYAPGLDPQWANLTPFALTSPNQFDPAGPPALTSQQWADAVNQVESLGAVKSTTRTAAETTLAQFWNDGIGTNTPSGHWNAIAQTVAQQEGDSLSDDARLFAELDVSMADAGIATWNTKYLYDTWRPVTVIQSGGDGVNPDVTADPTWASLLTNPNFPEYVSGHSSFSMAAATVLDSFFGDNVTFTSTEPTTSLSLTYTSFMQAATDAGMSRLYGGIHFLFSIQDGWALGTAVANFDLATFNVTKDITPPKVTLNNVLPSGASNKNVTITGQATDNLSGVAKLQVQVDGSAYMPLSFDATTGNFSYTTSFALDGSADGAHTINFQATDAAGNVAAPVPFTFTLASQAPNLTLSSPTNNGMLAGGSTLTGTAATNGGAAIVCLCYAFDGSTTMMPVPFNSDGTFSEALDLSKLAAGSHTLMVEAQDAAGNTTTDTLNLSLTAPIALTVSSLSPASGSTDVGVTYRPKVTFSRPIDTTSLNSANFYATDTTGAVIPATIVPSDDGTYALLFFTNPMPGASTVTLVVNGSTIKAADGSLLDAAGNGTPGSELTTTFTTVSTAAVAGTTLSGIVADPGPDDKPGTRDDIRSGADGILGTADDVYLRPIQGVEVYILGMESQAVYTNAQGQFSFSSVPSGDVKLAIEGNVSGVTVYDPTQAQFVDPNTEGFYFPQMTMDLTIKPGVANTVMGSMGTDQEQASNATNLGVYLPRVQTSILQTASTTQPTTVGVTGTSGLGLTPQQQQELTLTVTPNTAVGMNGQRMSDEQVGISTVPPQIVMDMLPAGVMQHSFDITIQAPGVAEFSTPATLTFPNVFNAAPGTQLDVLSFDHTTGRLVIDGTATVSADGKSVTTNPGTGVTQPGWHALTPPGALANSESATIQDVQVIDHDGDDDDSGTDDEDKDAHEEANVVVHGKLGDVVTVDLSSVELNDGSDGTIDDAFSGMTLTQDDSPFAATILDGNGNQIGGLDQNGNPIDLSSQPSLGGETFFVVPNLGSFSSNNLPPEIQLKLEGTVVNVGQDPNGPDSRPVTLTVYVQISDGYSESESDAVQLGDGGNQSVEPSTVDYYRVEQRLSYFGYNFDEDGKQVLVDGVQDDFEWANGVFNAAIEDETNVAGTPFLSTEVPWLNADNAPRWEYFPAHTQGLTFATDKYGAPISNLWGTTWAAQVLKAANLPADYNQVNSVSQYQGGLYTDASGKYVHQTHQAGMDVDVQVPEIVGSYFFQTVNGVVVAKGNTLNGVVMATGNEPGPQGDMVDGGILIYNPSSTSKMYAWPADQASEIPTPFVPLQASVMVGTKTLLQQADDLLVYQPGYGGPDGTQEQLIQVFQDLENISHVVDPNNKGTSPDVGYIYYNDPELWNLFSNFVLFAKGHNSHFHIHFTPPDNPTSGGSQSSNDSPADISAATGFGSDQSLYYRFALPDGTAAVYGNSNAEGSLSVFLGANLTYEATFYQPCTNHWADYLVRTNSSGQPTNLGNIFLDQFGGTDTNGDGIPDMGKIAMGLNPNLPDNTVDGLSYAQNLTLGLDPRGGSGSVTGVVANLALQGQAEALTSEGSFTNAQGSTTFLATGSHGLAVVDTSNFEKPTLLSQLQFAGNSTDVAVDPNLQIAVVASNSGGLNFVDVSNPAKPQLLFNENANANLVRVLDGVAYAAVGTTIDAYDVLSGTVLQTLNLNGGTITAMALDGTFLYTLDNNNTLHVIDLSGAQMVARGSVSIGSGATLAAGSSAMVVGGGVAYVGVTRFLNPPLGALSGYLTVDVSNPDSPKALSGFPTTASAGQAIAVNGSGIALTGGTDLNGAAVDVFNSSNTSMAGQFVGRFGLPDPGQGLIIADGVAFVADGAGGLQVINYLQFDDKGVAPTASISLPAGETAGTGADGNPEVVEGATVTLNTNVSDDVQVQNVELLLNGQVIANAVSFPFELSAVLPTIAQNGSNAVTLQVLAFDTGGNVGKSNEITLDLTPESAIPLQLVNSNVVNGSTVGRSFHVLTFQFNKAIDPTTVTSATFQLVGPNGSVVPTDVELRSQGHTLELSYPSLDLGAYTLTIDSANVKDVFGNALGSSPDVIGFTVAPFTITWVNPNGGYWDVGSNWSTGVVPGPNDDVDIDVPGGNMVTFRTGNVSIDGLTTDSPFTISGGTLNIATAGTIAGSFTLSGGTLTATGNVTLQTLSMTGGTLSGTGTVTLSGQTTWTGGTMSGTGATVNDGGLAITVSAYASVQLNNRTLSNAGTATLSTSGSSSFLEVGNNAIIDNLSGASFEVQNSNGIRANNVISGSATFNNQGTLTKSTGSGTTTISAALNNTGTVTVQSGMLSFTGGGTDSVANGVVVANGATLELGSYTLQTGASESGAGTLLVAGSDVLTAAGNVTVQNLTQSGGTLTGAGTVTVSGQLTWTGGTMAGTGTTVADGGLAITVSGTDTVGLNARTLSNAGAATLAGSFYLETGNNAVIDNLGSGTFDVQNSLGIRANGPYISGSATFSNEGTLTKSTGSGTTIISAALNNSGMVDVENGTISLSAGGSESGNATLKTGTLNITGGTYTLLNSSSLTGTGTLQLSGGTLAVPGNASVQNLTQSGGTLSGAGTLTASGALTWTGGTMAGTGTTVADGGLAITVSGTDTLGLNGRTLSNAGAATLAGSFYLETGNNAVIDNLGSGTFDVQNSLGIRANGPYISGSATFSNAGTLTKSTGSGTTTISAIVNNSGTVSVQSGMLSFTGGGSDAVANGLTVANGATLELGTYTLQTGASETGAGTLLVAGSDVLTAAGNVTVQNLTQSGGTLTGAGTVTVSGQLTWTGGTMAGTGTTVADGGLAITVSGTDTLGLNARTLSNAGAATLAGSFYLETGNNAVIDNLGSGTFDVQNSLGIRANGPYISGSATFSNAGTLTKSTGSGTTTISAIVNNSGTVSVQSGMLSFTGGGSDAVANGLTVANGATLELGTYTLQTGASETGAGTLLVAGSDVLTAAGNVTVQNLTQSGGTLTGAGTVTVSGQLTWAGGTMAGTGTTVADGGLAITVSGTDTLGLNARTLSNAGAATLAGSFYLETGNNAVIDNLGSGTFDVQNSLGIRANGPYISGSATFSNEGTLTKSTGSGTTIISAALNNSGMVDVENGTISLSAGGSESGNATLKTGTLNITGGTYTLLNSSSLTGTGTLQLSGGTLAVPGNASVQNLTQSGGTLSGAGTLTASGALTWTGGTMAGTGTTVADGGLAITVSGTDTLGLNARTLSNAGAATLAGSFYLETGNNAVIDNLGSGTFDVQNSLGIRANGPYISGSATFSNAGTLTKSTGSGTTTISAALNNTGTVEVDSGTLSLTNSPTNTSVMIVAAGATLSLTGNFTEPSSGVLNVQIGGTSSTQYSQIAFTNSATLAGTLSVSLVNGFVPAVGNSFPVITYASHTGTFDTINGLSLPDNESFTPSYNATSFTLTTGSPQRPSDANGDAGGTAQPLSQSQLVAIVNAAIARWASTGIGPVKTAELRHVPVELANLGGSFLGLEGNNTILIDRTADGYGWFIDATPMSDSEFASTSDPQEEIAPAGSPAYGRMDLLTVVMHELGHVLGLGDVPNGSGPDSLMSEDLATGVRRLPEGLVSHSVAGQALAVKDDVFRTLATALPGEPIDSPRDLAALAAILAHERTEKSLTDLLAGGW